VSDVKYARSWKSWSGNPWAITDDHGSIICHVTHRSSDSNSIDYKRGKADCALIAAAPEMLEALRYVRRFLDPLDHDTDYVDSIIAKAEGQA
jgi:hypothetical protein